ncbi:major facilitator superfamily protein [Actinidia rufa]|uniref:Major facilitator superfamily protein n=1 Tax=Actinidia rufa TaxID=165716 RepID=A0A7J0G7R6_9ERIC|nr:major facilitator superfamily protein [Actinidia rufa]
MGRYWPFKSITFSYGDYFVLTGKVYQKEQATARDRGRWSGFAAVQHVHTEMFYESFCVRKESCSLFRHSYSAPFRFIGPSNGKTLRSNTTCQYVGNNPLSMSRQLGKKFHNISPRRRIRGVCECCLTSTPSCSKQPRKLDKLGIIYRQHQLSKHVKVHMTRADYRSEDYDISGTELESFLSSEGPREVVVEGAEQIKPWWVQFPKRWVIVLLCFTAFLLYNMDRVNMSIAILPMSQQFNWNSATVGLIQSSFFWGYLLTQIVGGIWADKIGGKLVLGFGGVAMPAMNNILSKWIPVSERSRSLALVYSGMYLGSVTGLALSPILIHKFGWPSVFYSFGSLGSIWFALWLSKAHSSPQEDPELTAGEKRLILGSSNTKEPVSVIPWKLILSKPLVWALIISHFCHNWGTFILLTWMPTYYNQVLKFNLTESRLLCVLPWLTMAVFANIGGWIADTLVSKDNAINWVLGASLLPYTNEPCQDTCFSSAMHGMQQWMSIEGSDAFSQSGLYSNHQDIGPRYAGVLLGLSNTAGVLAGVFGTAATGYILQKGSWDDVFKVSVALYIIGTVVWNLFSTGEKILD